MFKNISKKYRPIPFWSWNEKLNTKETASQVCIMNDTGMSGFFMHARGGLQTEYLGDEWFENVEAAISEAEKNEMMPWAYDENGWPSGFGSGKVCGLGTEYQQKYLRIESEPKHLETAICKNGEHYFYYDINPFYVDTLDEKVVKAFIDSTYEPYYKKFCNRISGFFTDEPQISRNGIPWSFVFEEEYKTRYNENILEQLEALFLPVGDYKRIRINFWKMVTELFSKAYCKQIFDWCDARGLKLTGHLVLEETLKSQLVTNGACMPHYEYFHIPGADWLGRNIYDCLTARQVSSVAEQLGKEQVLTESFALCGHNISFSEFKGIYEWQMVRGINLLCTHLEGYSIRGMRKRDYPPAIYFQQPWWKEFDKWIDAMSRIGMILAEGEKKANILLIHPQTTAWALYDNNECAGLDELNQRFIEIIKKLESKHLSFHLGDEIIMERHASVEDGRLVIGKQKYDIVIDSCCETLLPKTKELLSEYKAQGGKVCTVDELDKNDIIDTEDITYTSRKLNGTKVHYFVNTSAEEIKARINIKGEKLDIYTGEMCNFNGIHRFEPWGSLMIFEGENEGNCVKETESSPVYLCDEFDISKPVMNFLTLDKCDYYFDGVLQEKNGYVLNICERANALERPVKIHQDYFVQIEDALDELFLICETPWKFDIYVNDEKIDTKPDGWVIDKSFERIDISKFIKTGTNKISFDVNFKQSDNVYKSIRNAKQFEGERNKLSYDIEIENIYIMGRFGVKANGEWEKLDKNAVRYLGPFVVTRQPERVSLKNLEQQGFPFFCGEMKLKGQIDIKGENPELCLDIKGINVVKIKVGNKEKLILGDNKISLKEFGKKGITEVEITLINNLRNLLGPHHLTFGEAYSVSPGNFYKEKCVWNMGNPEDYWNDGYCLAEMGI